MVHSPRSLSGPKNRHLYNKAKHEISEPSNGRNDKVGPPQLEAPKTTAQISAQPKAPALEAELNRARAHINELESKHPSSKKKLEQFLRIGKARDNEVLLSPQDLCGQWSSTDFGDHNVNRAMKGCIQWTRGAQKSSLKARFLEARMRSQKVLLRQPENVLKLVVFYKRFTVNKRSKT
ncbi:50S ribosomal protein L21 [Striga asiatica]|uniref:50S ribosomal protein L21 n=1 Tax=Striga asiatica TaxID=4170 RepID=A0A5A7RE30_STRAF|nr:50S ribosomal protein L21 [Striga asiatica]